MSVREYRMNAMYDFAVEQPEGFTVEEAMAALDLTHAQANKAIRDVRLTFADDEINLVCDPQGRGDRWLYRLVGTIEAGSPWVANRNRDLDSRLHTIYAVSTSLARAADGRTVIGRRAKRVQLVIGRLIEDLAEIAT